MLRQWKTVGTAASGIATGIFAGAIFLMAGCQSGGTDGASQSGVIVDAAPPPTLAATEIAKKFDEYGETGYQKLDDGDTEGALTAFAEQVALIPESHWGYYNTACVYGRGGDAAKAMAWLAKAVDHGFCDVDHMSSDSDIEPTWKEPAFEALKDRARMEDEIRMARFAQGMPQYDAQAANFADKTEYENHWNEQRDQLKANRYILNGPDYDWAKMDFYARRASSLRDFFAAHPDAEGAATFNLERERLWALERLMTIWGPRGPLADAAVAEARMCLKNKDADPEVAALAHFVAGKAEFCRERPKGPEEATWVAAVGAARDELVQVPPASEVAGRAEAFKLYFDLAEAGDLRAELQPRVQQFIAAAGADEDLMGFAGNLMQGDLVQAMWPVAIEAKDLKGKDVKLAEYAGKTLLIDFWATWCGPCRRELPALKEAYATFHDKGFEVLSISLDYPDRMSVDDYKTWIAENDMNWRHVYDGENWESPLAKKYLVTGIPSSFLVDKNGHLVAWGEQLRGEELAKTVERVVSIPELRAAQ